MQDHNESGRGGQATTGDKCQIVAPTTLEQAALQLAREGRRIFPCAVRKKSPATPDGFKSGTTDVATVAEWWSRQPRANIGVTLGKESGVVVVDIEGADSDHKEHATLEQIRSEWGELPDTVISRTSGGGLHLWYAYPADHPRVGECTYKDLGGFEVRIARCYVLVPPSVHPSGVEYAWLPGHAPGEIDFAPCPEWLVDACVGDVANAVPADDAKTTTADEDRVPKAVERMLRMRTTDGTDGSKRLFACACRCVEYDLTDADAVRAIRVYEALKPFPRKWSDAEIRMRIHDAENKATRGGALRKNKPDKDGDGEKRSSGATRMVEIVDECGIALFHTPGDDGGAFADILADGIRQTWPIRSKGFRQWLTRQFYKSFERAAGSQALQDALGVIEARALFDGEERQTYIRLATHDGDIFIDLANNRWEAVRVTRDGWSVVASTDTPVRFLRRSGMLALPTPKSGGTVGELREFVNITDHQWPLLLAWLVAAFRPCGPFPILRVEGEQGSAKSTLCRIVRDLIDPNRAPLRRPPRKEHDLMISASNSWVVCFDNLSGLKQNLSDGLCVLATGGGFSTRKLYTDDSEKLFDSQRPIICNGIADVGVRADFLDRALSLTLPVIPDAERKQERDLWARFESARARILGALLDAVSMGLGTVDDVQLDRPPRMADFATWVVACSPALGLSGGQFLDAYSGNREDAHAVTIEASAIGPAILGLMHGRGGRAWTGTAKELLSELEAHHSDDATRNRRDWPHTPRKLSGDMRRLGPVLRASGIAYTPPESEDKRRIHRLATTATEPPEPPQPPDSTVPTPTTGLFAGRSAGGGEQVRSGNRPTGNGGSGSARAVAGDMGGVGGCGPAHSYPPSEPGGARTEAARLIRDARRRDRDLARDVRDAWRHRLAVATVDGVECNDAAERAALSAVQNEIAQYHT